MVAGRDRLAVSSVGVMVPKVSVSTPHSTTAILHQWLPDALMEEICEKMPDAVFAGMSRHDRHAQANGFWLPKARQRCARSQARRLRAILCRELVARETGVEYLLRMVR